MPNFLKAAILSSFLLTVHFAAANAAGIGVLDLDSVMKNSKAVEDMQGKLVKKQESFQELINKKQDELEASGKKLASKKSVLSEDAFVKEQKKFDDKIIAFKADLECKQNILKKASLEAMDVINEKVNEILIGIGKEKDLDIIFHSGDALYYKDSLDISADVRAKLNESLTKVNVKFDDNCAAVNAKGTNGTNRTKNEVAAEDDRAS